MTAPKTRELDRFNRGADAIARHRPDLPRSYVCPLCRKGFSAGAVEAGVLTLEHAPPRALGGRPVVLTCRDCNNRSGYSLDAHMRASENIADVILQTLPPRRRVRGRLGVNKPLLDIDIGVTQDVTELRVTSNDRNRWFDRNGRLTAELLKLGDGDTLHFTIAVGDPRLTELGWLRSAYLVAFAALGYRYIYQPQLQRIREQLFSPLDVLVSHFHMIEPNTASGFQSIGLVQQPEDLRDCVFVRMGRHTILLPPLLSDVDPYRLWPSGKPAAEARPIAIQCAPMRWPRRPELACDFWDI